MPLSRDDTRKRIEEAARARAFLRRDPLLERLRRVSRYANVPNLSISDSAPQLRAKLHAHGPHKLVEHLEAQTQSMLRQTMPAKLDPQRLSSSAPSLAFAGRTLDCTSERETPITEAIPRLPLQQRPSTAMGIHTFVDRDTRGGTNAKLPDLGDGVHNPRCTHSVGVDVEPHAVPDYLAEVTAPPNRPGGGSSSHSVVLSQVIVLAERLEMEHSTAALCATTDATRGVETARAEALRGQVAALRALAQQCQRMQQDAEAHAEGLAAALEEQRHELKLLTGENARLKWTLSNGYVGEMKEKAVLAFMASRDEKKATIAETQAATRVRQMTDFQRQVSARAGAPGRSPHCAPLHTIPLAHMPPHAMPLPAPILSPHLAALVAPVQDLRPLTVWLASDVVSAGGRRGGCCPKDGGTD